MDVNEPVVEETTEKNPFGIEPESYAELEENHPKLYKNTSSGQSPKNPFDGGSSGGGVTFVWYAQDYSINPDYDPEAAEPVDQYIAKWHTFKDKPTYVAGEGDGTVIYSGTPFTGNELVEAWNNGLLVAKSGGYDFITHATWVVTLCESADGTGTTRFVGINAFYHPRDYAVESAMQAIKFYGDMMATNECEMDRM